ncbi:MAG: hypothetical protein IRY99_21870 [Isosphaeraceae bacterium]|nr:hypothetical protein [Isosphaeraceae bacterium]
MTTRRRRGGTIAGTGTTRRMRARTTRTRTTRRRSDRGLAAGDRVRDGAVRATARALRDDHPTHTTGITTTGARARTTTIVGQRPDAGAMTTRRAKGHTTTVVGRLRVAGAATEAASARSDRGLGIGGSRAGSACRRA